MRTLRSCLLLLILFTATPAAAQFGSTPTDGVRLPENSITHRDDAAALELNPAGLAHVQGLDAQIIVTTAEDDLLAGTGLLIAGRPFDLLGLGGGVQWNENPALGGEYIKFTLGFATNLSRLALGLAYNFFASDTDLSVDDFSSWDAGAQIRLANWLALSGSIRDFNTPILDRVALLPRYTVGMGLRFDSEGRYLFDFEAIHQATDDDWFLRARTSVEPLGGLTLFVEAQSTAVDDFDLLSLQGGLAVTFGSTTIGTAFIGNFEDGEELAGTSSRIRLSIPPLRSVGEPRGFMTGLMLSGALPERGRSNFFFGTQRSFLDLLLYLDSLARDEHTAGLVLQLENVSYGLAQHWELRQALQRIKDSGKEVVVYMHTADFGDLYLASVADRVYMHPGISFFPRGLSTTLTYLGELFENIGVTPEFVRIAEYKSAPEALTEAAPSEATLEAINTFYDDVFGSMVTAIAEGRGVSDEQVRDVVDEAPLSPSQAESRGFVDGVCFMDELEDRLAQDAGRYRRIFDGYDPGARRSYRWTSPPSVAVIYVDGNILEGTSGEAPIVGMVSGHRTLIDVLEAATRSSAVRAIVLRIDSPGGSAWASEAIWRAIAQANEEKPVIVSMGDVAASGGYYVAAGGSEIFATDLTLTGSIGIFSGHFAADQLLNTIGVHRYPITRGTHSNIFGIDAPWTDEQREAVFRDITIMYDVFLERVAANRESTTAEIDPIARGRIWSGSRGREVGLVDEIGGLLDAIERAKVLAGLERDAEVRVVALPERSALGVLSLFVTAGESPITEDDLSGWAPTLEALGLDRALRFPILFGDGRPLARLPFELDGVE